MLGARKNIIVFMTDQWRWDTVFEPGHVCRTPNLDAFAASATGFRNALSPVPLCTPARGSLMTGRWPHQNGLTDNVQGSSFYPHGMLHPDKATYLGRLADSGYDVAYVGKWHLGQGALSARGISKVRLSDGDAEGHKRRYPHPETHDFAGDYFSPFYGSFTSGTSPDEERVQSGIELLRTLREDRDRPFCLMISLEGPHFPHFVPKRFVDLYANLDRDFVPDNYIPQFTEARKPASQSRPYWPCQDTRALTAEDWRKTCQHYWGFCTHLDDQFGRFAAEIERLGLRDETVTAFCTDHGEMLGAHGWFDKGPFFYDEIMRIPLLIRDPDGRAPADADSFVSLRDLFPTLISLAGTDDVLDEEETGRSYWSTTHDRAFFCYDAYQGRQFKLRGVRTSRFKYSWSPNDLAELYDLETDPGERENVAGTALHRATEDSLRESVFAWMRQEGDYLLASSHLLPVGSYIDGRPAEAQHDHGVKPPRRMSFPVS